MRLLLAWARGLERRACALRVRLGALLQLVSRAPRARLAAPMSNGDANELFLFHGTSQLPSMSVLEHYDGSGTGLPSMRAGAPGPT